MLPAVVNWLAGMVMEALPELSAVDEDVYPPPKSVTVPVGAGPAPATVTATNSDCDESNVPLLAGVTVTDAVDSVTVTFPVPVAPE